MLKDELLDMIKVLETSAYKNIFNSKTILEDIKYDSFIFVLNKGTTMLIFSFLSNLISVWRFAVL